MIYLISSWMLLVYIAKTRLVWSCWKTRCSMTSQSISRSNITISGIWCREEQWSLVFSRLRFLRRGSDESVNPFDMVAQRVPHMVRCKCRALLTWSWDVFPPWSDISVEPFWQGYGMCSCMVICECWACLSDMVLDVFLSWSDVSAGWASLTWCQI